MKMRDGMTDSPMRIAVGFDTSAYTTSAAAVDQGGNVLVDVRRGLQVKAGERGLRQSQALFQHIGNLPVIVDELFGRLREDQPGTQIVATAVSTRPRSVEGSYMPVFLAGMNTARAVAAALGVSCFEFSHQEGHIAAASGSAEGLVNGLAFHLSGGTGEILETEGCRSEGIVGGTRDLSFGQLIDRTGVACGLGFPAGAQLDRIAVENRERTAWHMSGRNRRVFEKPRLGEIRVKGSYANLSGIETSCQKAVSEGVPVEELAPELFFRIADAIRQMILSAAEETGRRQICLVGGVAASRFLRKELTEMPVGKNVRILFGEPALSPDNAVGIARLGMRKFLGNRDD